MYSNSLELFDNSLDYNSDNAVDDDFQCNIDNYSPQLFNQSIIKSIKTFLHCRPV